MTCPDSGGPTPEARIKVLQLTDPHLLAGESARFLGVDTAQTLGQVLSMAQQDGDWPPDVFLLTGDCAQQADVETYARLRRMLSPLGISCYCLPGNHDEPLLMETELNQDNVYYRRQILAGNWQLVMLNSAVPKDAAGRLAEQEFVLLENLLSREPNRHTAVVLHHQPVPVFSEWLDTMALPPDNRERLFHLLGRHRQVRLILWGHIHQEFDSHAGSLRLLATPSTCFQFVPKSKAFAIDRKAPGCRWLYLHADGKLETRVQRLAELPEGLEIHSMGY